MQYERYQPRLWRPAVDAVDQQRGFFLSLLGDEQVAVVVAMDGSRVAGFAVARLRSAPPVYDPGGSTCLVDDFAVDAETDWPAAGPALVAELHRWGAARGAVQMVVVTAHLDEAKRRVLREGCLSLAAEWWTRPI